MAERVNRRRLDTVSFCYDADKLITRTYRAPYLLPDKTQRSDGWS